MVGQTTERTGGGCWTYPVRSVKIMSLSTPGSFVQTFERSVDVSKGVDPLGVLNVTMPIILIRLRQPFHVTSMGHHWLRSKMKFGFREIAILAGSVMDTLNTVGATYLKNGPKPKTTKQKTQRS